MPPATSYCPQCGDDADASVDDFRCETCGFRVDGPLAVGWCTFAHGASVRGVGVMILFLGSHVLGILLTLVLVNTLPSPVRLLGVLGWLVPVGLAFRRTSRPPRPGLGGPYQVRATGGGLGGRFGFGPVKLSPWAEDDAILLDQKTGKGGRLWWRVYVRPRGLLGQGELDAVFDSQADARAFADALQRVRHASFGCDT